VHVDRTAARRHTGVVVFRIVACLAGPGRPDIIDVL
jgi:hypothetical protein